MPKIAVLLSHELTDDQLTELGRISKKGALLFPDEFIQNGWKGIDIDRNFDVLKESIITWLSESTVEGDYILVQGEYGMTFQIVTWSLEHGRIPIYAFSARRSVDKRNEDGSVGKISVFAHRRFAYYIEPDHKIYRKRQRKSKIIELRSKEN